MARAREDRYQNAAEFQRELQTLRDRHNQVTAPPIPAAVADMARHAFAKVKAPPVPTPPAVSDTDPPPPVHGAPRPRIAQAPPPARIPAPVSDPKPPPREPEPAPSSSSVEIPITFSNDTPLSGENMPVEATEFQSHAPSHAQAPPRGSANAIPQRSAAEMDDDDDDAATQYYRKPAKRGSIEDDHTTQKRGPELGAMLNAIEPDGGATEVMSPRIPIRAPLPKRPPTRGNAPPDESVDTIVKPNSMFPRRRGGVRPRQQSPSSPDDTIKMGDEIADRLAEVHERLNEPASEPAKPRAPKVPR
jgi:hypothetical protein